jgi:hypothetical protein
MLGKIASMAASAKRASVRRRERGTDNNWLTATPMKSPDTHRVYKAANAVSGLSATSLRNSVTRACPSAMTTPFAMVLNAFSMTMNGGATKSWPGATLIAEVLMPLSNSAANPPLWTIVSTKSEVAPIR